MTTKKNYDGREKNFGDKLGANRFQIGHPGFHVSMKDPAALLISKLKKNKLEGAAFVDAVNNLAKLLWDTRFEKPETRKLILPFLDAALKYDLVSGPSFTWAFNLSSLWHATPNYAGPYVPPKPKEPTAEEVAARKLADAEAERLREEEREAKARAETAEQLRRSAFLDLSAKEIYLAAKKAGKIIFCQLPDGSFIYTDEFPVPDSIRELAEKWSQPAIVWLKSKPSKNHKLTETDEDLRWGSTQPEPKTETKTVFQDETPASMAANSYQAHCQKIYDRFARTRKITFTEIGKDSKNYVTGTVHVESAVFSKDFYNVRAADFKRWETNNFDSASVPRSMSAPFADALQDAMTVVPARGQLDPFTAGIQIKPYGFAKPRVEHRYSISQTGLAGEYEAEKKRRGWEL